MFHRVESTSIDPAGLLSLQRAATSNQDHALFELLSVLNEQRYPLSERVTPWAEKGVRGAGWER